MEDQSRWANKSARPRFQFRHFAIIKAAQIKPGMSVLDVATGRGETAILAAQAGAIVHATDIHQSLVEIAEKNALEAGFKISTSVADMRDLSCVNGKFDLVLVCAGAHHLNEDGVRKSVRSAVSVLTTGGRALFLEPIANIPWFEIVKCTVPTKSRPSILNRSAWKNWLDNRDDRWLSDSELLSAWPNSRIIDRFGLLSRIRRNTAIEQLDEWLLGWKALHPFAQAAIAEYRPT